MQVSACDALLLFYAHKAMFVFTNWLPLLTTDSRSVSYKALITDLSVSDAVFSPPSLKILRCYEWYSLQLEKKEVKYSRQVFFNAHFSVKYKNAIEK